MNNILIAEDEHLIARLIEMTLTRAGYTPAPWPRMAARRRI